MAALLSCHSMMTSSFFGDINSEILQGQFGQCAVLLRFFQRLVDCVQQLFVSFQHGNMSGWSRIGDHNDLHQSFGFRMLFQVIRKSHRRIDRYVRPSVQHFGNALGHLADGIQFRSVVQRKLPDRAGGSPEWPAA